MDPRSDPVRPPLEPTYKNRGVIDRLHDVTTYGSRSGLYLSPQPVHNAGSRRRVDFLHSTLQFSFSTLTLTMRTFSIIGAVALSLGCIATANPLDAQVFLSTSDPSQAPLAPSKGVTYSNCGLPTDPIQIESVEVTPNPPKPGGEITVKVNARATEVIEDGAYAHVTVKLGLIKLLTKEFDLCEEARKAELSVQCPVQPGHYTVEHKVTLPKEVPRAKFTVDVLGYTVDDDDLMCLKLVADFIPHPF
ncbi:hypothetical protein D9756_003361 [Leucocoprinus leucothites]|uniref:Phosphatidylglycerol/phosphatidylinositol transfer protein n=1 Tax=Leucocoprinus leucothites TaxID=201217 RepID=A0A8H5G6I6_9AGAR|nr:hypothetical protein D9756_003361 [Leucoagaricus leucothites]